MRTQPTNFCDAVYVWCAAAGVAGAYLPTELAPIVDGLRGCLSALHNTWIAKLLPSLVDEAWRRADWFDTTCSLGGSSIPPRKAEVTEGALVWRTSVETTLRLVDAGWVVEISAPHPDREAALREEAARHGVAIE